MLPFEDDQVSLDGENAPDGEPVTDAAGQVVTPDDDAPLSANELAHAKHAAAVVTGQASVAPPPIEATEPEKKKGRRGGRRPKAATFEAAPVTNTQPPASSVGEPVQATQSAQVFVNDQPITAENIKQIAASIAPPVGSRNMATFLSGRKPKQDITNAERVAKDAAALTARMNALAPTFPKNPKAFFNGVLAQIQKLKSGHGTSLELASGAEIIMSLSPRATKPVLQQMFDYTA